MLNLHLKKVKTNTHPVINDPTFSPLRKIKAMTKLENFQVQSYLLITTDSRTATPHMLLRVLNNVNWNIGNNHKSLTCSSSTWITLDPATRLQYSNLVSQFTSKPLFNACTALVAVWNAATCSPITHWKIVHNNTLCSNVNILSKAIRIQIKLEPPMSQVNKFRENQEMMRLLLGCNHLGVQGIGSGMEDHIRLSHPLFFVSCS